jgi:hypothetical protein
MIGREQQSCAEIAPLVVFYLCDELDTDERSAVESHLSRCQDCAEMASQERAFQEFVASATPREQGLDSAHILLSQCRSELAEKLDDLALPRVKEKALTFVWMRRWMAMRPVWSGAFLVILGLLLGAQSTQWFAGRRELASSDQAMNVRPQKTRFTDDQLSKIVVAGVNFAPSPNAGPQNLRVSMSAEEPVELTGSMDDSNVRQVLSYVVKNGERFEPGVRLDCLDALKSHVQDLEVRSALMAAARKDSNPAVRLKALDALRDSTNDRAVRETLLKALQQDGNPGVRVEAVNLLVRSLEIAPTSDIPDLPPGATAMARNGIVPASTHNAGYDDSTASVIRALEDLQHSDPNRYVRLRSASALRQIHARNEQ